MGWKVGQIRWILKKAGVWISPEARHPGLHVDYCNFTKPSPNTACVKYTDVRSLTIDHWHSGCRDKTFKLPLNTNSLSMRTRKRRVTKFLSKSLIINNMRSLSVFRVTSYSTDFHGQIINGVSRVTKILWSVCKMLIFSKLMILLGDSGSHASVRLQTFCCRYVNNVSRIIKSQSELQILGLEDDNSRRSRRAILKTLRKLHNAQLFLPIVFISGSIYYQWMYKIGIFPAFCSVDRRATIPEVMEPVLWR